MALAPMTDLRPLRRLRSALRASALLVLLAAPSLARAADPQACVEAYEEGQKLRSEGSLQAAKERFLICADPGCPAITKSDCTTWVSEVDQSQPTIIFAVTDREGKDVTSVRISVDGKLLLESLDGKAKPIDPGSHRIVVELDGEAPVERELVVREGEKNRKVDFSFAPEQAGGAGSGGGSISPATWVLGGIGVAGIAVFATFGALGLSEKSDAETTCAPNCTDDEVGSIRTKFIIGDIGLGVGVASLAAAVIVGIVSASSGGDEVATLPVRIGGAPAPGGGMLTLEGVF
jgi:hypothetical protein